MPGKSQTPALRFAGFTGEWVERKLGEMGITQSGNAFPENEQGGCSGIPFFKVSDMNLSTNDTIMVHAKNYVTREQITRHSWKINSSRRAIVFAKVGAAVLLNRKRLVEQDFLLDNNMMAYNMDESWNLWFGKTLFDRIHLPSLVQVGALPSYRGKDVEDLSVASPSTEEQSAIGRFFRKVDALITQQQKKVEKLQGLKKGLMKKMFPRGGCTLPEVRFAGFDGEWVERKVKEVCSISTGKSNTQDRACDGKYPFYVRSAVIERSHKYLYDEEAVLTVGDGAIGKIFHYVNGKYDLHQRVYRMYDFSEIDARFFYYIFSKDFGKRANSMTAKTSVDSVRMEMIADMEFAMPEKAEQSSIGRLFRKLDTLITLHGEKLEKLRHVKQALLGKMFV